MRPLRHNTMSTCIR